MEKGQCIYINRNNKRCEKSEAVRGCWYCNSHLNKLVNLRLKKSAIKEAGTGLFAGSDGFKKNTIIGEYSRYDIKKDEKKVNCHTHKCSEYLYCDDKICWDAKSTPSVIVRYANDARDKRNNAYFENFGGRAFMMASKKIKPGEEIFCDYGDSYDWSFLEK